MARTVILCGRLAAESRCRQPLPVTNSWYGVGLQAGSRREGSVSLVDVAGTADRVPSSSWAVNCLLASMKGLSLGSYLADAGPTIAIHPFEAVLIEWGQSATSARHLQQSIQRASDGGGQTWA